MEDLKRHYAYFHRGLLELLLDLVGETQVYWLTDKVGHEARPEGEANSYHKAVYALEDLGAYRQWLQTLELVRQGVLSRAVAKPVGVLVPAAYSDIEAVVLSRAVSWASHVYSKQVSCSKSSRRS